MRGIGSLRDAAGAEAAGAKFAAAAAKWYRYCSWESGRRNPLNGVELPNIFHIASSHPSLLLGS